LIEYAYVHGRMHIIDTLAMLGLAYSLHRHLY
jgi:hypothetical protein